MTQLTEKELQQKQAYAILSQEHHRSSRYNGKPYTEIEFVGINDQKIYKTYVQRNNFNGTQWGYILDKPKAGFVLTFHNFKMKVKDDRQFIDADSVPKIEIEADKDELFRELEHYWQVLDRRTDNPTFDNLFEI